MQALDVDRIDEMALGATLLGAGGGGDPYLAKLLVKQAIEKHGPVMIAEPHELPPDGLVLTTAVIGAPTVLLEKIVSGPEFLGSVKAMSAYLGKEPVALMPIEVGGLNTIIPLATATEMGLPVIDADSMRRAFPQIEMTVFTLAGIPATPMSLADQKGNLCVFEATSNQQAEELARGATITLGLACAISCYPMTVSQIDKHGIQGSMAYCVELGTRLMAVQKGVPGAYDEFVSFSGARNLFTGKVIDLDRRTTDGFAKSTVTLEHLSEPGRLMRVEVQNENLIAFDGDRAVITTPDLICFLDHETATPITTETVAYGQRLDVVGLPCAPEWHQPGMPELVGPRVFGYDLDYVPFEGGSK